MELLTILFASALETFFAFRYFEVLSWTLRVKKSNIWKIYFALFIALSLTALIDGYGIRTLTISLLLVTLSYFYKSENSSRLFFVGTFIVVCGVASVFAATFVYFLTQMQSGLLFVIEHDYLLFSLLISLLIFGFVKFFESRGIKADASTVNYKALSLVFAVSVILVLILEISIAHIFNNNVVLGVPGLIAILTLLTILLLFNMLILIVIDYKNAFAVEQNITFNTQRNLDLQMEYYKELLDQHRLSHKEVHDLKNKIQVVMLAVKLNKSEFALRKLEELAGDTFVMRSFSKTGNDVIDAILGAKESKLELAEVGLNLEVNVTSDINMNDFDLSVIIGNAVDNAIEACTKLPVSDRYIEIEIVEENNTLTFTFANQTSEDLVVVDNVVQTSKETDRHLHGFGLSNMREIASKYDGYMNINCEDGFFELEIVLRIPPQ